MRQKQLLNDGIDQLVEKPQLLNLKQVVPILAKANHSVTIIDLCMRKVTYLKRLRELRQEDFEESGSTKAMMQCYDVVMQMFSALDRSITEQKDKRSSVIGDTLNQHRNKGFYGLFFNHFTNEIPNVTLAQKAQLRKNIIYKVQEFGDRLLVKQLFSYLVNQPVSSVNTLDLPILDAESLQEVSQELFSLGQVTKTCLDAMVKLMLDSDRYGAALKPRLCEIVLKICEDDALQILKLEAKSGSQE